jgi:hypothetical protein
MHYAIQWLIYHLFFDWHPPSISLQLHTTPLELLLQDWRYHMKCYLVVQGSSPQQKPDSNSRDLALPTPAGIPSPPAALQDNHQNNHQIVLRPRLPPRILGRGGESRLVAMNP